jgi:tRNA (guanine9-N1)-methyltransferase
MKVQPPIRLAKSGRDGGGDSAAVPTALVHVEAFLDTMNSETTAAESVESSTPKAAASKATRDEMTSSPATDDIQEAAPDVSANTMSKNQLKKKRRWEKMMEIKKRRKLQDKQVKLEKAKAQGRDIEAERAKQEAARLNGESRQKRRDFWERKKLPLIHQSFQVCIDCAYESFMTAKEINSLALQIRYCYSANKRNAHPCQLAATSVGGGTLEHLKKVNGFDEWSNWAFTVTPDSLEQHYQCNLDKVVYLTSDSETVLETLDDSKIYVIGGIVDRNRLKRAAFDRSVTVGVATARLPIDEHLQEMASTRVLTCNHVFELLLKYREHGRDWKKALLEVLPNRKDAKFLDEDVSNVASDKAADCGAKSVSES